MQVTIACKGWSEGEQGDRDKQKALGVLLAVAVLSWVVVLIGNLYFVDDSGLTPEEKRMASRIHEIAEQSRGDWNRVSSGDQRFLIEDVSFGDETSARMLLSASAGKLKRSKPVAPPRMP
jgi:hypothetical protein